MFRNMETIPPISWPFFSPVLTYTPSRFCFVLRTLICNIPLLVNVDTSKGSERCVSRIINYYAGIESFY